MRQSGFFAHWHMLKTMDGGDSGEGKYVSEFCFGMKNFCFSFCVWVWDFNFAHHTAGFGNGCFLVSGFFPVVDCVWEDCLFHTAMLNSMLGRVSVVVGACWQRFSGK